MQSKPKIILGIDPGTVVMGYGILAVANGGMQVREMNSVRFSSRADAYEKLHLIHTHICTLVAEHRPSRFAIEAPFYGKNVQSMLKLGRAQGVAIAAAMQNGLRIHEYSPRKIKQSITGNGNASKEQVQKMLMQLLKFSASPKMLDASDALAVAVCHHFQERGLGGNGSHTKGGWENFIRDNPGRVL